MKTLKKSNKTITDNKELAETFNEFFSKIVPNLNISQHISSLAKKPYTG